MVHCAHPPDAQEASLLCPRALLALGPVPSSCILQKPPGHLPTPGFASLVQLPELSLQPLLHGGWVLTASSSFFWKADDVAILNSCASGLSAPRDFLARPLLLAFSICGGRVACSVFFHSLLTQEAPGTECPSPWCPPPMELHLQGQTDYKHAIRQIKQVCCDKYYREDNRVAPRSRGAAVVPQRHLILRSLGWPWADWGTEVGCRRGQAAWACGEPGRATRVWARAIGGQGSRSK